MAEIKQAKFIDQTGQERMLFLSGLKKLFTMIPESVLTRNQKKEKRQPDYSRPTLKEFWGVLEPRYRCKQLLISQLKKS